MLFSGAPAQNLVKTYIMCSSPLRDALASLPEVTLAPTHHPDTSRSTGPVPDSFPWTSI